MKPTATQQPSAQPPAWILLRGLTRESGHWAGFAERMAARFPDTPLVCLDLPGNGSLHRRRSPTHIRLMSAYARQELWRRGLQPPFQLLSVSLGGMVACDWAGHWPQEVARMVLVNTSMRPYGHLHERLRPRAWGDLLRVALLPLSAARREQILLARTSQLHGADTALAGAWAALRERRPVSTANALRQLLAAARFRWQGPAPDLDVLVLASKADQLVDPACSRRLAAAWNCRLAMHPSAGHDLTLDAADWVLDQLADPLPDRHREPPSGLLLESGVTQI